jgi:hypothetical protein
MAPEGIPPAIPAQARRRSTQWKSNEPSEARRVTDHRSIKPTLGRAISLDMLIFLPSSAGICWHWEEHGKMDLIFHFHCG